MDSASRKGALVVSIAAAFGAALVGTAEAGYWSWLATPSIPNSQSAPDATDPAGNGDAPTQLAGAPFRYRDGLYPGPITDAYYGPLQVQAKIAGGRIVSIDVVQYPADRRASRSINSRALPELQSEVIAAQSDRVDLISGATLTSEAYLRSLNAALRQAGV